MSNSAPRVFALVALSTMCFARWVYAAWPHDPYGGNVPVCTASGDQRIPKILPDGTGGAFITWADQRGAKPAVYVQRLSAAGVPLWTTNGVALCNAAGDQLDPAICSDGAGGAIVVWRDYRSGTSNDIYAQRVNAVGALQWGAAGLPVCTAPVDQLDPEILADGSGGGIVTWDDKRNGANYDIYVQRVNSAGAPQWAVNGVALCTAGGDQLVPEITTDGSGAAVVTWTDYRGTVGNIYAQRVSASGVPQWATDGIGVCTNGFSHAATPAIATDGAGGAFVAWQDSRNANSSIFFQHVLANGTILLDPDGMDLGIIASNRAGPQVVPDGVSGAIVEWIDQSYGGVVAARVSWNMIMEWSPKNVSICASGAFYSHLSSVADGYGGAVVACDDALNHDVVAQRVDASGVPQWGPNGVGVSIAIGDQSSSVVAVDAAGNSIVAWQDSRSGPYDIYAQNVDEFGYLGTAAPAVIRVADVPMDQGGHVKVTWSPSYLDAEPYDAITQYRVWRSAPPNLASGAGAGLVQASYDPARAASSPRTLLATLTSTGTYYWELVATEPGVRLPGYSAVVATTSDSMAAGNPYAVFMIEADGPGISLWFSSPDSGYSVDNLAPATPTPFTGRYLSGATWLHWGANHDADLLGYRLYRGSSAGFAPGPGNLIAAQPDTGFADSGPAGSYYKLSAVDLHGNESPDALLAPGSTISVGAAPRPELALDGARPNPSIGDRLEISFTLPGSDAARLELLDVNGREIVAREVGLGAGRHTVDLAEGRTIPAGLYFAHLIFGRETRFARVVVVR